MYQSQFGLSGQPFRANPDIHSYYPATTHEAALGRLLQGLDDGEGLCLLTATPGLGKTLLCHVLADRLGAEVTTAFLTNCHLPDRASLFQAILYDLAQPHDRRREQDLRLAVTDYFLSAYSQGRRHVLLVDEAHLLSADLLEELRLLGNLEGGAGKALQVVLAAQPIICELRTRPELQAFWQRLAVRVQLEPLGLHESSDYLAHQVRVAGGKPGDLFTDEAFEVLAGGANGIPRLLNQAAHRALVLTYQIGCRTVDAEAALEALDSLGLKADSETDADRILSPVSPTEEPEQDASSADDFPDEAVPIPGLEIVKSSDRFRPHRPADPDRRPA
jgi:type II secretory pathway predicted ATPase ExeA